MGTREARTRLFTEDVTRLTRFQLQRSDATELKMTSAREVSDQKKWRSYPQTAQDQATLLPTDILDEILQVDDDVWLSSLEHEAGPRTGLSAANAISSATLENSPRWEIQ